MDGRRGPVFHAGEMRKIPAEGQQKLRLKKKTTSAPKYSEHHSGGASDPLSWLSYIIHSIEQYSITST